MSIQEKLRELREAEAAATKGPWAQWYVTTGAQECPDGKKRPLIHGAAPPHQIEDSQLDFCLSNGKSLKAAQADAAFIALTRNHFSAMLDVIEAAQEMNMHLTPIDINWGHESLQKLALALALERLAGVR